jgi:hypothetical protein
LGWTGHCCVVYIVSQSRQYKNTLADLGDNRVDLADEPTGRDVIFAFLKREILVFLPGGRDGFWLKWQFMA